jgi:aconitate hydratase
VLENVIEQGGGVALLRAGAVLNEPGCLCCIGTRQAPGTGQVSLGTFPRNFPGRSGSEGDQVFLCSPETAAAAALRGSITDPRELRREMAYPGVADPARYLVDETSPRPRPRTDEVSRSFVAPTSGRSRRSSRSPTP